MAKFAECDAMAFLHLNEVIWLIFDKGTLQTLH
jgi:hypothetical protein